MKNVKGLVSFMGVLFLALIAFFLFLAIKIGPIYFENYQLQQSFKSVIKENPGEYNLAQQDHILTSLVKMFQVNQITSLKVTDVQMNSKNGKLALRADYDVVKPIIGNLSVMAHFDTEVE